MRRAAILVAVGALALPASAQAVSHAPAFVSPSGNLDCRYQRIDERPVHYLTCVVISNGRQAMLAPNGRVDIAPPFGRMAKRPAARLGYGSRWTLGGYRCLSWRGIGGGDAITCWAANDRGFTIARDYAFER